MIGHEGRAVHARNPARRVPWRRVSMFCLFFSGCAETAKPVETPATSTSAPRVPSTASRGADALDASALAALPEEAGSRPSTSIDCGARYPAVGSAWLEQVTSSTTQNPTAPLEIEETVTLDVFREEVV